LASAICILRESFPWQHTDLDDEDGDDDDESEEEEEEEEDTQSLYLHLSMASYPKGVPYHSIGGCLEFRDLRFGTSSALFRTLSQASFHYRLDLHLAEMQEDETPILCPTLENVSGKQELRNAYCAGELPGVYVG
jgi:hypothetical protein